MMTMTMTMMIMRDIEGEYDMNAQRWEKAGRSCHHNHYDDDDDDDDDNEGY